MSVKVLFLGPQGSYSQIAVRKFKDFFAQDYITVPIDSISKIIRTIKSSENEQLYAVMPIENSIEGVVRETQDNLRDLVNYGYRIIAETQVPIEHSLLSFGQKTEIKTITSHPQALAQCREYIYKNWQDDISVVASLSTSNAVLSLSKDRPDIAAIGSKYCADLYNVPILESAINDEKNNATRFVLLSKNSPLRSERNKISITFSTDNKPGALNRVLNILEKYNLNMSYIDSRPSRRELGEYIFYVDFEGHSDDSKIPLAMVEMQEFVKMFEVLSIGAVCV